MPSVPDEAPRPVALPRSSIRLQKPYSHVKLLSSVKCEPFNTGFEGKIYSPGANVPAGELPDPAVALECVGPVGSGHGHKRREILWILWRYDRRTEEWVEIARAQAVTWEWALVLREPAIRALHPRPEFCDLLERGRDLAGAIMESIDEKLQPEIEGVKANVLTSVYDQVAGRIANL